MKLDEVLIDENAELIADYIGIRFEAEVNDAFGQKFFDNVIDYDFNLQNGKMVVNSDMKSNTLWKFDVLQDRPVNDPELEKKRSNGFRAIKEFQAAIISLKDYEYEQEMAIKDFNAKISNYLQDRYIQNIRNGLRRAVLKGQPEEITPLEEIIIVDVEIGSLGEDEDRMSEYVYSVRKAIPSHMINNPPADPRPLIPELLQIQQDTGLSFDEIIAQKKREGDPSYLYVQDVIQRKQIFDCMLELFVDYSPRPFEEIKAFLSQQQN